MLLLAASALSVSSGANPADPSTFRATTSVSVHATARITVISGVRFGADYTIEPAGAARRQARLIEADGQVRPAELLEFQ